ncbi:MAG: Asp-tRNA(Asn)/Glu-tRNA(Gln) amidotransferase subunit GatB [Candidatus Kerfeldbacteria bacterium]|nr:Asp-tRNA(Asn)/Glu-tRNA(Gln) amidotransferase subunit GatB [Candidatus Kerfeldbacteria bacterium]
MAQQYEIIIGLETHVQMKTKTKMFCGCKNSTTHSEEKRPNVNVCPVCMGHPGTLPVLNNQAVNWGIRAALALDCAVPNESKFDRKNYFYPDLPKGYQISQYDEPIGKEGKLIIAVGEKRKRVGIERLHLEEDAAKLLHTSRGGSGVDFNRAGAPLMEIVTKPDVRSPEEAKMYLTELKLIMQYLGVSDADMEKGQLRCDANISLRPVGEAKYYPKTEIKNMNSFRNIERALQYEVKRQTAMWDAGTPPSVLTTRRWDDVKGETVEMRTKEEAHDYRYFPEPDLPPLVFTKERIQDQRVALPELPDTKRKRFVEEYGIALSDSVVLISDVQIADFFERVVTESIADVEAEDANTKPTDEDCKLLTKLAVGWITTELFKLFKAYDLSIETMNVTAENFAELLHLVYRKHVNSSAAQELLAYMVQNGGDPSMLIDKLDLRQMADVGEMEMIVAAVIKKHAGPASDYRNGKDAALQFLVGMVMKETKGKANPQVVAELLKRNLRRE